MKRTTKHELYALASALGMFSVTLLALVVTLGMIAEAFK